MNFAARRFRVRPYQARRRTSGCPVDLLQFLLDKNNIFIVAVTVVSGVMLAIPALRKGRTGSAVSTTEAIQMVNQQMCIRDRSG